MTTNEGEVMQVEEEVTFMMEEDHDVLMNPWDKGQYLNFNNNSINNADGIDEPLDYYHWLADSATTSHIANQREAFITYKPLTGKTVVGVGNNKANVEGRGTIELESLYRVTSTYYDSMTSSTSLATAIISSHLADGIKRGDSTQVEGEY